jgi:DNA adenine methylase
VAEGMTIKALAPWFGSKRTLAPRIVAELGEHHSYFEPFCGSMAVLLAKPESRQETVNDLHRDLTNLARVLAGPEAIELYARCSRAVVSDGLLADAAARLRESWPAEGTPDVDRAFWYFVQSWMMRNGVAGTNIGEPRGIGTQLAVRYTASGGSPSVRFRNAVESMPAWHDRLRNVVVLTRDAFDVLAKIEDAPGVVVYVDSPYTPESRSGYDGAGAQSRYLHEFKHQRGTGGLFVEDDHSKLAHALRRFRSARVIVSYYDCPRVRDLYAGWTFVACTMSKGVKNGSSRGAAKTDDAPEVLIVNGPSFTEGA